MGHELNWGFPVIAYLFLAGVGQITGPVGV